MNNNMPTTRKELCAYINKVLTELQDEADDSCDRVAKCTVTIKGNSEFIYNYIQNMCTKYNDKNTTWHCDIGKTDESNEYNLCVFDATYNEEFDWQEDDSEEPLEVE